MPEPTMVPARRSVRFDLGGWGLRLANHRPEYVTIVGVAAAIAITATLVPIAGAFIFALETIAAAQLVTAVVLSFLPVTVDLSGPGLRAGLRRTDAARLTRAVIWSNGREQYLHLSHSELSLWVICIARRGESINAEQRDALEQLLSASAIELPPIKTDRYDPTGRFSRIGTSNVTKADAIAAVRGAAPMAW